MCEMFVEIMCILFADNTRSYSDNVRKQVHSCYVCFNNLLGSSA